MLHVLNYTEKLYACKILSGSKVNAEWSVKNPGMLRVTFRNLPGNVVRAVHGEHVVVGYTTPDGECVEGEHVRNCLIFQATNVFTLFAAFGIITSYDNETLYLSSSDKKGWLSCLRDEKVLDLTFTPRQIRHKLLATAALEGIAVMSDSFSIIPNNVILDQACYTVSQ